MDKHLGAIEVVVTGLRSQAGQVLLALFGSPEGFPGHTARAVATRAIPIRTAQVTASFEDLLPGDYAVAVVHDANSNGKLDTTWFGVPKDGIGFSNNPRLLFGAPKFTSCVVRIEPQRRGGAPTKTTVRLRYFLS